MAPYSAIRHISIAATYNAPYGGARRCTAPYGTKYSSHLSGAVRHRSAPYLRRSIAAQCGAVRRNIVGPLYSVSQKKRPLLTFIAYK
uniref:Uncharacterized protein n=1 Tax=Romanomermis culicivorax TaxID=13658 RepID=A0A915JJY4_ROMCU